MKFALCPQYFFSRLKRIGIPALTTATIFSLTIFPGLLSGDPSSENPASPEGFHWPILKGRYPDIHSLTSTFAESRNDHFHNGLDIAGLNEPIHPVKAGRVLFSREESDDPFVPVPGPGNFVLLDHGEGHWSGYDHMQKITGGREGNVSLDTVIGYSGNEGHSTGAHLHFFIIDQFGNRYINPLRLLPPSTDANPPVIGQLVLITPTSRTFISHSRQENIRLTRYYPILVQVIDPGLEKSLRRGVYKLEWRFNDGPVESRTFDFLLYKNGEWKLSGLHDFPDVFVENYYNLGKLHFVDGDNRIVVRAMDYNGNVSEETYTINVRKEF